MGIEAEVSAFDDGERIILDAHGAESGLIIGKKGATLDALQYVINRIISKKPNDGPGIVVDAEGYRGRREDSLGRSRAPAGREGDQERASGAGRADEPARSADRSRHAGRASGRHDGVRRRRAVPPGGHLSEGSAPPRAPEPARATRSVAAPERASRAARPGAASSAGSPRPLASASATAVRIVAAVPAAGTGSVPSGRRPVSAGDELGVAALVRALGLGRPVEDAARRSASAGARRLAQREGAVVDGPERGARDDEQRQAEPRGEVGAWSRRRRRGRAGRRRPRRAGSRPARPSALARSAMRSRSMRTPSAAAAARVPPAGGSAYRTDLGLGDWGARRPARARGRRPGRGRSRSRRA